MTATEIELRNQVHELEGKLKASQDDYKMAMDEMKKEFKKRVEAEDELRSLKFCEGMRKVWNSKP